MQYWVGGGGGGGAMCSSVVVRPHEEGRIGITTLILLILYIKSRVVQKINKTKMTKTVVHSVFINSLTYFPCQESV